MAEIKLVSWNVNGIRAAVKNGFVDFLKKEQPDVLGLQEIKITDEARAAAELNFAGYEEYWFPAKRPGYSGTAVLVKEGGLKVVSYHEGLGSEEFDAEGRVQVVEFEKFYFINAYFPNSKEDLSRLDYKQRFNAEILKLVKKLEKKKPVTVCGDFNVAHEPIDLFHPKQNEGKKGYTKEERGDMTTFLESCLVDTFRLLHPGEAKYSWWSYYSFARDRGIGWRIDYFLVSASLKSKVKEAFILDDVFGSDHCPVGVILDI